MARQKKPVHRVQMTDGKRNIIRQQYDIETAEDIQDALKDLLGGTIKEMMEAVGLKNRPNFLEYSLTPAVTKGLVKMKFQDSPRHPRQKYLLTVKGLAVYDECVKSM